LVGELLSLVGVSKGFWRGQAYVGVLKDVSLDVGVGEVVAITSRRRLGGKTTLLEIAAGMQHPDSGSVTLAGRDLQPARKRWWALWEASPERSGGPVLGHDVVWVSGNGPHRELEVSKYVGSPLAVHGSSDVRTLAAEALDRVGARDCVGRRWGELSNWQRALVGLARGFAGSPQLVVFDDILDGHTSRDTDAAADLLRSLLAEANRPCAVLLSTGYYEAAVVLADQVWTITPRGTLARRSGRTPETTSDDDATILPFPAPGERQDSHRIGSG
ncbi:MAG: ATP-binding cassette domain-containing protein, partial [Solirubrobacteraceae bacterium]